MPGAQLHQGSVAWHLAPGQTCRMGLPGGASCRGGQGGKGIAVRKPLALQVLHNECTEHGQSMMAEVHGSARSIRVAAAYRPPSADFSILEGLLLHLENGPCRPWILGMDGNTNMLEGRWPDAMTWVHGVLQAVARHDRSSHPIDAIWTENTIRAAGPPQEHASSGGDHSIAECSLDLSMKSHVAEWRHAKTCALKPEPSCDEPIRWDSVATCDRNWLRALGSVEEAWHTWSKHVETWLLRSGWVVPNRCERSLPSEVVVTRWLADKVLRKGS